MKLILLLAALALAETPMECAKSLEELGKKLDKTKDKQEYAQLRLQALEKIALLQDWALRVQKPEDATKTGLRELTPEGKAALGKRKPVKTDFK